MVYTETAAVSRGISHVRTKQHLKPLEWIFRNVLCKSDSQSFKVAYN